MARPVTVDVDRSRIAWWGIVFVLGAVFLGFALSFLGTLILGVFFYYAVRPLNELLHRWIDHRSVSALATLALILVPILAVLGYTGLLAVRELLVIADSPALTESLSRFAAEPQRIRTLARSPEALLTRLEDPSRLAAYVRQGIGAFGTVANALLHLTLALAVAYFLLRDGARIEQWFQSTIADEDGIAAAYVTAADADLQTVYFGNVLSVVAVAMLSLAVYHAFNIVAPASLTIPVPTLLAMLTGLATFVPLVVGKLVYVPLSIYLAYGATQTGETSGLVWVAALAVVSFLLLDLIPQTFVRPYLSGQSLHSGLVLLAYVFGAALFGWYGLFLGPFILVLVVQAANIVLPELLHGDPLTPETYLSIGSNPDSSPASPSSPETDVPADTDPPDDEPE